jgi:hypothetical protein
MTSARHYNRTPRVQQAQSMSFKVCISFKVILCMSLNVTQSCHGAGEGTGVHLFQSHKAALANARGAAFRPTLTRRSLQRFPPLSLARNQSSQ